MVSCRGNSALPLPTTSLCQNSQACFSCSGKPICARETISSKKVAMSGMESKTTVQRTMSVRHEASRP
eukprot:1455438-Rhodomonas_salina.1